jgi:hypothetical protein
MEGRFVAKYAQDALDLVLRYKSPSNLVVNLSEVNFVDAVGEDVLACFGRLGVKFVADSAYALDVCERLHLPLVWKPTSKLPQAM